MTAAKRRPRHNKHALIPILMVCAGYACYNLTDAGLKTLLLRLHFSQAMMTSNAIMIILLAAYGWFGEGKKAFRTGKPGLMLVHALLAQAGSLCCILAFPHIQLTTFYTLVFTSPFCVALLSGYFLKDRLDKRCLAAILFGFCVILYIFRPGGGVFSVWSLLVLANSILYSFRMVLMRHIGTGESRAFMFMTSSLAGLLTGVFFLGDHYVPLTGRDWGIFAGVSLASAGGLLCIGYAFQTASSASVVAPYHYTQIIWGALLGFYFFGEVPEMRTMMGAAVLIATGIYLIRHEMRKAALTPPEG